MNLYNIINSDKTDKNTVHSYLDLYQQLFSNKQFSAKNILEIGIDRGGSIKLWSDFFINATIYGLDTMNIDSVWEEIINIHNIKLYTSYDAYDPNLFNDVFLRSNIKFDVLLDDGPHTLESMILFIKLYSQIMTDDGILIIEDVQSINWINDLINAVPENLKSYIKYYDLRKNKNRYDDIVFTIDKSNNNVIHL
jgi:cephalosporin hydroxylase